MARNREDHEQRMSGTEKARNRMEPERTCPRNELSGKDEKRVGMSDMHFH